MRILVTGGHGFIGAHVCARLVADGHDVIGAGRKAAWARRRFPYVRWIDADFRRDVAPDAWFRRLDGVDTVINCVGVLQDAPGDSVQAAHVDGADALFAACEACGVRRVIHVSAVGVDADTAYARTKRDGEDRLKARDLDWVILRPSLVLARQAHGGTALIRGLAGVPFVTPLPQRDARFQPVWMHDLTATTALLAAPGGPSRLTLDVAGPTPLSLEDIVRGYRRWLGFGDAPVLRAPPALTRPLFALGDAAAWLGAKSALRTTSERQMAHGVAADPGPWTSVTGIAPQGFEAGLAASPATAQDRWHARLVWLKPVARLTLGLYWILSGVFAVTLARASAFDILAAAGFSTAVQAPVLWLGAALDVVLGAMLLVRLRPRPAALAMIAVTVVYVAVLSVRAPWLWADALAPILKVFPMMALAAFVAAIEEDR